MAEGAALAAVGPEGALVMPRRQSRHATCAIARAPAPIHAASIGRPRGYLAVIGIGPGDAAWRTPEASALLAASDDIVGYRLYLDLLGHAIAGKVRHDSEIGAEEQRVRLALDLAAEGRSVALVSSINSPSRASSRSYTPCELMWTNRGTRASRHASSTAFVPSTLAT